MVKPAVKKKPPYIGDPRHKNLFCKLYEHQKNTVACVNLRGRRVCRANCAPFFEWANDNHDAVVETANYMKKPILEHLKQQRSEYTNILENVLPKGNHVCEHCGLAFKRPKALERHLKRKHKRELRR